MKKSLKGFVALMLAVMMIIVHNGQAVSLYADQKSEAQSKKAQLEKEQSSKEAELAAQKAEKSKTEKYISEIDGQLTDVSTKIYELDTKLEEKRKEIKKTEKKLKEAEEDIKVQYADMKKRIKFMYENGNTQYLNMLLSSDSIADFLNKAEYVSKITEYDRNMLYKMEDTKNVIETAKVKLEKDNETLVALKEEQQTKQSSLETLLAQKENQLAKTVANINKTAADISSLSAQKQQEENRLAEIERIEAERRKREQEEESRRQASVYAAQQQGNSQGGSVSPPSKSPSAGNGKYIWPLPSQYRTRTSSFGYRPDPFGSGATVYHCGDDYPAPAGTPIYAVADGTVDSSQYSSGTGNCVVIYHGNGLSSIYMHASVLIARAGQTVKQGDVIALVGTTGPSTGNHLHISFRLNGQWVDPKNYIGG